MLITSQNLQRLQAGFKATFQNAFDGVQPTWERVGMRVPSMAAEEVYGYLKDLPGMREWAGDRVIHNLATADFTIRNKHFELTIGVNRNAIEDDRLGVYSPFIANMGMEARTHPDEIVWPLLNAGFDTKGPDGQYFFDTDHPGYDANGNEISVSNVQAGAGTPWFLLDTRRPIKPLIYQDRRSMEFRALDQPTDENAFMRNEFLYGVDGRDNAGYGLWQLAFGSKDTLDATNYAAAKAAMSSYRKRSGKPLGVRGNLLVVPPSLEAAGRQLIEADQIAGGGSNIWRGSAELLVVEWLA